MGRCSICGVESDSIPKALSLCARCIRADDNLRTHTEALHRDIRSRFGLPPEPPASAGGRRCGICANRCCMGEEATGYCGVRSRRRGTLRGASARRGTVSWYFDPLPTNCVADWVCPGGSHSGYPTYSYTEGPEYGYRNLAVFYYGCSFDCLFCQNWQHKRASDSVSQSPDSIASCVDESTSCVCFFGGDPAPQLPHALATARLAVQTTRRILRICWETNGSMHPALLEQMIDVSLRTGGCIKFDLKTWNENLSVALCGRSNERTLSNFEELASSCRLREDPPLAVASTLLVPGYVDEEEVYSIASFISKLSRDIPYCLLAFYPQFVMNDVPQTSRAHAERCLAAARRAGLRNVRTGNTHLLI